DGSSQAASGEVEISGLLHDIQYQGASTRYEIQLENGQNLSVSQANIQWQDSALAHQPGQRVTARWAREAMIALHDNALREGL
ncbi:TOBE domain-containing protein, partial [Pseudomonas sp.]|uniref:TOBE domain-containing protein n=1 Tax=Pseudomonas sp. TaxID=306 RepID=UPI002733ED23